MSSLSPWGSGSKRRSLCDSWLSSASRRQIVLVALLCGALVFIITAALQFFLAAFGCPARVLLWATDAIAGILAFLLTLRLARERRQFLTERLRIVAALNHGIRNALELIQLTAHMTHDAEAIEQIGGAVEHIQRSLRAVLEEPSEAQSETTSEPQRQE